MQFCFCVCFLFVFERRNKNKNSSHDNGNNNEKITREIVIRNEAPNVVLRLTRVFDFLGTEAGVRRRESEKCTQIEIAVARRITCTSIEHHHTVRNTHKAHSAAAAAVATANQIYFHWTHKLVPVDCCAELCVCHASVAFHVYLLLDSCCSRFDIRARVRLKRVFLFCSNASCSIQMHRWINVLIDKSLITLWDAISCQRHSTILIDKTLDSYHDVIVMTFTPFRSRTASESVPNFMQYTFLLLSFHRKPWNFF